MSGFQTFAPAILDRNTDKIFQRLFVAVDSLFKEVGGLPSNLPPNFESSLKPYADEVKSANTALAKWASETHAFSGAQVRELSTAK